MPTVFLFPYLAIEQRVALGQFEVIPGGRLTETDCHEPWLCDATKRHLDVYDFSSHGGQGAAGCVLKPPGGIGEDVPVSTQHPLRLCVLAALLEGNEAERGDLNAAAWMSTSDNSLLFGHPVTQEGYLAITTGTMVRTTMGGLNVNDPKRSRIVPPTELHVPSFIPGFDAEYAGALLATLLANDDRARRLERSLEWLDLAWRNSPSITQEIRIVALRAAFEVLLDKDGEWADEYPHLSTLLDTPQTPKHQQTWTNPRNQKQKTEALTDLQWWYTQFVFLRNDIAHGRAVPAAQYQHDGRPHVLLAEETLRRLIRIEVAQAHGPHDLTLPLKQRRLDRAAQQAAAHFAQLVAAKAAAAAQSPTGEKK